jgi:hypothetical protein
MTYRVMEDDEIHKFLKNHQYPLAVWTRYDTWDCDSPWEFIIVDVKEAYLHNAYVFNNIDEAIDELSKYYNVDEHENDCIGL